MLKSIALKSGYDMVIGQPKLENKNIFDANNKFFEIVKAS